MPENSSVNHQIIKITLFLDQSKVDSKPITFNYYLHEVSK